MSGFLRRLVERHATEPATRPRALSRFETGAPRIGGPSRELPAPPSLPEDPSAAPVRRTADPPADPLPAPIALRRRPGEARPTSPTPPGRPSPETAVAPAGAGLEPTNAGRPGEPREPFADPAQGVETSANPVATLPPRSGVGPIVPRKSLVPARADMPAAGRARDEAGPAAREPDVVRVHIGRVEVRAIVPPAAPPTPRPRETTGPLSLDRYLARRESP